MPHASCIACRVQICRATSSYMHAGQLSLAIQFFRRALEFNPQSPPANQGMLALHHGLTLDKINGDPELTKLLDFRLCLDRAEGAAHDAADQREDPGVQSISRARRANATGLFGRVDYLRVISLLHQKRFEPAAGSALITQSGNARISSRCPQTGALRRLGFCLCAASQNG